MPWLEEDTVEPESHRGSGSERRSTQKMEPKMQDVDPSMWRDVEKSMLLQTLDHHWKEHLSTLDALRQVVFLRAYAQKTPLNEYKQESFALFQRMLDQIREDVTKTLATSEFGARPAINFAELPDLPDFLTTHIDPLTGEDDTNDQDAGTRGMIDTLPPRQVGEADMEALENNPNISRNAPCPCGSGRKYKHCHGQV